MINYRIISNILGLLLLIEGIFMLLCIPITLLYGEKEILDGKPEDHLYAPGNDKGQDQENKTRINEYQRNT